MSHAESFRDLIVYQQSRKVTKRLFELSESFPREEAYSLTDQVRRSSRSIGAQLAEAWAKRRYEKHFVSKLTDADGEQQETQHWVEVALDCHYIDAAIRDDLVDELARIGGMLQSMINKADLFCRNTGNGVREEATEYFTDYRSPMTDYRPPTTDD